MNPVEERKLTGTGTYKIEDTGAYGADEDEEDNYSSDEFESDEEESESNSSIILNDGCSGSTVDTSARGSS